MHDRTSTLDLEVLSPLHTAHACMRRYTRKFILPGVDYIRKGQGGKFCQTIIRFDTKFTKRAQVTYRCHGCFALLKVAQTLNSFRVSNSFLIAKNCSQKLFVQFSPSLAAFQYDVLVLVSSSRDKVADLGRPTHSARFRVRRKRGQSTCTFTPQIHGADG